MAELHGHVGEPSGYLRSSPSRYTCKSRFSAVFTKPWANAPKGLGSARVYLSLVAASEVGVWCWPQDPLMWMRAFTQFLLACLLSLLCTRNSQMWSGQRDRRQPLLRDPLKHPALLLLFSSLLADSYLVLSYLRGRKKL